MPTRMYENVRTDQEINDLLNVCDEAVESGDRRYPMASYEEGLAAGIRWLTEIDAVSPYSEAD